MVSAPPFAHLQPAAIAVGPRSNVEVRTMTALARWSARGVATQPLLLRGCVAPGPVPATWPGGVVVVGLCCSVRSALFRPWAALSASWMGAVLGDVYSLGYRP